MPPIVICCLRTKKLLVNLWSSKNLIILLPLFLGLYFLVTACSQLPSQIHAVEQKQTPNSTQRDQHKTSTLSSHDLAKNYRQAFRLSPFFPVEPESSRYEVTREGSPSASQGKIPSITKAANGDYLLISQDNKNWLVPTFQFLRKLSETPSTFENALTPNNAFVFRKQNIQTPELTYPALLEKTNDNGWLIKKRGEIAIPDRSQSHPPKKSWYRSLFKSVPEMTANFGAFLTLAILFVLVNLLINIYSLYFLLECKKNIRNGKSRHRLEGRSSPDAGTSQTKRYFDETIENLRNESAANAPTIYELKIKINDMEKTLVEQKNQLQSLQDSLSASRETENPHKRPICKAEYYSPSNSEADYFPLHSTLESKPVSLNSEASLGVQSMPSYAKKAGFDCANDLVDEFIRIYSINNRSELRRLAPLQLNITLNSEEALMRSTNAPTQLEVVQTGGSYLLIQQDTKNWLVPDFQTLSSFTTNQLKKGIFTYIHEPISEAVLRRPAEVKDIGGLWEVVTMGVIAIPS